MVINMKVSIRDVAREAGVSITTVSHALNGYPDVAQSTCRKIKEVANRLDYQPNINGRNLARKGGNSIALVISDLLERDQRDITTFRMIQGVYAYCREYGLEVAVYAHDPEQLTYSQFCKSHAVEGAILSGIRGNDPCLEDLMEMPIPFVAMDMECFLDTKKCITIDNVAAAAAITRLLLKKGHHRILVVADKAHSVEQADREIGVRTAMEQEGVPLQENDILHCEADDTYTEERCACKMMEQYLEKNGNTRHTAVLCLSDFLALGVRKAIKEAGYSIPGDFSITGFGGTILSEYIEPSLTTVEWDAMDCGYAAAQILHARKQGIESEKTIIPYHIAVRDSVKKI